MMSFHKFQMVLFSVMLILTFLCCVIYGIREMNDRLSHEYVVTSSSGHSYYIDDYTIEDGSIVFYVDGVQYHFSDYSVRNN